MFQNFCSNWCYKASLYLKEQVLTSPVWLRDNDGIPVFHVLPRNHKGGCAGDEVNLRLTNVTPDEPKPAAAAETVHVDNLTSFAMSTLEELQQIGGPCYNNLLIVEKTSMSTEESESASTTQTDNQFSKEEILDAEINKTASKNDISSQTVKYESIEILEQSLQVNCNIESGNNSSNIIIPKIEEDTEIPAKGFITDENTTIIATKIDHTLILATDAKLLEKQKISAPNITHLPKTSDSSNTINKKIEEAEIPAEGFITDENTATIATKIDQTLTLATNAKLLEKQKMNAPNVTHLSKSTTISREETQLNPTTPLPFIKAMPIKKETQQFNVNRLETVAHEWFTLESAIYLFGIDNIITKLTLQAERFEAESHSTDKTVENQFFKLYKELEDKKIMSEIKNENQKKQLSMLELKVRAFYEGKTRINPTEPKKEETSIIMPACHRYDQKAIRQKIVLTKLAHV